jgi:hypothetical protein
MGLPEFDFGHRILFPVASPKRCIVNQGGGRIEGVAQLNPMACLVSAQIISGLPADFLIDWNTEQSRKEELDNGWFSFSPAHR